MSDAKSEDDPTKILSDYMETMYVKVAETATEEGERLRPLKKDLKK